MRLRSTCGDFCDDFAGFAFSVNFLVVIFDCICVCPFMGIFASQHEIYFFQVNWFDYL